MGRPTPHRSAAAIPAAPARRPSPTPLAIGRVTPAAPRPSSQRGWTLMLVPPPRAARHVRSLVVRRWHLVLPPVLLAVLLIAVSFGATHIAARVFDARVLTEVHALQDRLDRAERGLGTLADSLARLSAQAESMLAAREAAAVAEAASRARVAAAGKVSRAVVLPVNGRITSRFAPRRMHPVLRIMRPHRGLDIAAPSGTPVRAPADARVTRVAREFGYGLVIFLDHGNGVTTRYAHLRAAYVTAGQRVTAATQIGTVGESGLATAPHLHYEVRVRGEAVDPARVAVGR